MHSKKVTNKEAKNFLKIIKGDLVMACHNCKEMGKFHYPFSNP